MGLFRATTTADAAATGAGRGAPMRRHRVLISIVLTIGGLVAGMVWHMTQGNNFHVVGAGKIYRSAQLDRDSLLRVIEQCEIKSILNLRGPWSEDWYYAETNASQRLGLKHIDFTLSAGQELTDLQMDELMATIEKAPKPLLIHCKNGSDRTGLAGALYLYTFEGKTAEVADRELTIYRGHFPYLFWRDTAAMDRSFWRYVGNHARQSRAQNDSLYLKQTIPAVVVDQ